MLQFIILCVVVGAALYVANRLPLDATIKMIINVVAVVVFAIYALRLLWPMAGLG